MADAGRTQPGQLRPAVAVGRAAHTDLLTRLLTDDDVRLITVLGEAGVGRSTVVTSALEECAHLSSVTVRVKGSDDVGALADRIVLGLPGRPLSHTLPEAFWEVYGGSPIALVLLGAGGSEAVQRLVPGLLDRYPALVVVATASEPLGLPGERLVPVDPLPLPTEEADSRHPAMALFERVSEAQGAPRDLADPDTRAAIAALCRRAGGLPLGIELAAARSAVPRSGGLARALATWAGVATEGERTPVSGGGVVLQRSLGEAIDELGTLSRQVLLALSVFEGPFQLEAAAEVVGAADQRDLLDPLAELVETHLLQLDASASGAPRFVMLPPVCAAARVMLRDSGGEGPARRRHADYFTRRCDEGRRTVRAEWDDIAAAVEFRIRSGTLDEALAVAVAAAPGLQDLPGASTVLRRAIDQLLERNGTVGPELRVRSLVWSGALHPPSEHEDPGGPALWTRRRLAEATSLAREDGDDRALLEALEQTVRAYNLTLDHATVVAAGREGLAVAGRIGDAAAVARFESWRAMAHVGIDDGEAARLAANALAHGREVDEPLAVVNGARILHFLPVDLRPHVDPPLPDLESLLAECERASLAFGGMMILHALAAESLAAGDIPGSAGWLWRFFLVAADRYRSEPLTTLGGVAPLITLAVRVGEYDDALRLRDSVRGMEDTLPLLIPPSTVEQYREACAELERRHPGAPRAAEPSSTGDTSLLTANHLAQELARRLATRPTGSGSRPIPGGVEELTPRETEVLLALASGATNREIGELLGLSAKTVMHHSVAIYRKLGVRGRAGATAWAFQQGLVPASTAGDAGSAGQGGGR